MIFTKHLMKDYVISQVFYSLVLIPQYVDVESLADINVKVSEQKSCKITEYFIPVQKIFVKINRIKNARFDNGFFSVFKLFWAIVAILQYSPF